MVQTLFKVSDYRWPVIGSMWDLNAASIEDFKSFYHRFYSQIIRSWCWRAVLMWIRQKIYRSILWKIRAKGIK